jgi:hypothetical protein
VTTSGHYFHQDLLVADKMFINKPGKNVEMGSRIDGFVAHVTSFRDIEVFYIRDMTEQIQNIHFKGLDIMDGNAVSHNYCNSISYLHALEHFGLERYGDRVDSNGHLLGWENIYKMLKKGGKCYFSVPIGKQGIEFDAHRVYSLEYLVNVMIGNRYKIDSFSYVSDKGDLVKDAELDESSLKDNCCCYYGCGIFDPTKV